MTDTISIAVICGSLRQGSFNAAIVREFSTLAPTGISFRPLDGMERIPHYNADVQSEGFPAIVLDWADIIRSSDAVVFVTPECNYSIPGVLKNALDWLSRLSPPPFSGKPVAIQTASVGMLGGARAQYHLRQVLLYFDALVLNKPEIMIADAASKISPQGELTDDTTRRLIAEQLAALQGLIRRVAAS
ncbi:NAD(P)H-dependent oxidoreductase [Rhizobium ruizarguesonis]|uniref:NADPH-dependent FMN reductase n=1 Tax=Rhizobium ruizarguesonis TaxID=2081791 RepID=UPI001031DC8B|nr:NADPH-dependent FMN reductase [Rhizobium ruizarguesonis]TAX78055.1 NAD(P)H-dependent oxidoreductase [Rhizobium ruizarguesonis]